MSQFRPRCLSDGTYNQPARRVRTYPPVRQPLTKVLPGFLEPVPYSRPSFVNEDITKFTSRTQISPPPNSSPSGRYPTQIFTTRVNRYSIIYRECQQNSVHTDADAVGSIACILSLATSSAEYREPVKPHRAVLRHVPYMPSDEIAVHACAHARKVTRL